MLELSAEQELIRATVRRLAQEELAPLAGRIDAEDWFPRDFFRKLGEIGTLGVLAPEEYGGSGGDYLSAALIMEELARVSGSVALSYGAHAVLAVGAIARDCSSEQKARVLPALCTGEALGAWALTEPGAGSDALGFQIGIRLRINDQGLCLGSIGDEGLRSVDYVVISVAFRLSPHAQGVRARARLGQGPRAERLARTQRR